MRMKTAHQLWKGTVVRFWTKKMTPIKIKRMPVVHPVRYRREGVEGVEGVDSEEDEVLSLIEIFSILRGAAW